MLLCRSGCCLPLFGDAVVPMKTAFCFHFSFLAAALSGSSPSPAPPLSAAGGLAGKEFIGGHSTSAVFVHRLPVSNLEIPAQQNTAHIEPKLLSKVSNLRSTHIGRWVPLRRRRFWAPRA